MRMRGLLSLGPAAILFGALALGAAGCGDNTTTATIDLASKPDLNNCQETGTCPCVSDPDCAGNQNGPRCDKVTRACVACLPDPDNCPNGQVCQQINGVWSCVNTCAGNADCQKLGGGALCCGSFCVDPAKDVKNCGGCNAACPPVNNGSPGCSDGNCIVAICNPGWADCNKASLDGCEVNTNTSTENCGACGNVCKPFQNGLPTCIAGKCSAICGPGFADCNNNTNDGCEIDTTYDVKNCGGCGKTCNAPANADPACDQGACKFRCKPGFADCDGNPANGCEVNNNNDGNNCGHCGNICPLRPNAMASSCVAGQCVNTCNPGFGDCDNKPQNGCEADLQSSLAACGACGKPCLAQNAVATCDKGMCTLACSPGFVDCNMDGKDGCEAKILEDANNCGACGNKCPQNNPFCSKGVCGQTPPYPAACSGDADPVTKSYYIICAMNAGGAWIASDYNNANAPAKGTCTYNALQICQKYNFTKVSRWGGTCGTVCGYCSAGACWAAAGACNALNQNCGFALGAAYTTFDSGGGNPQGGASISCTVMWECAP